MNAASIRNLFIAAINTAPEDRLALLENAGVSDEERAAVLELLAHDHTDEEDTQFQQPIAALRSQMVTGRFGAYELQQQLGRGGMGAVYKAERVDGEVRQTVAIKVLDREWIDAKSISRFRRERQILAGLSHANIARLLDTGTRDDGRPYLVMEFIAGMPLDRYCEERNPTLREKLRLFQTVCRAVEYAHSKLVIHRDLKPSNIMVTAEGVPKLLDFGIARALDALSPHTTETLILTPQYASPDQARGDAPSTATDIYGLGAVLYFLLTGSAPHQMEGLSAAEAVRRLCETEPVTPSSLKSELKGDLENITRKAMHRDPERRYGSARELADDVENYLATRPVRATPDGVAYRVRRFVARRRWFVASAAIALLVIAVSGVSAWNEKARADEETAIAKAVSEFLRSDLISQAGVRSQVERGVKVDPDLKVRTLLDRASASVATKFRNMPKVEAAIHSAIGGAYADLGLDDEARKHYQRAREIHRVVSKPGSREALAAASQLAESLANLGKGPEAEAVFNEIRSAAGRDSHGRRAAAHAGYGIAMMAAAQKRKEATPKLEQAISELRSVEGSEHESVLTGLNQLAVLYLDSGDGDRAEALFRDILSTRQTILGARHPDTLASMSELGVFYNRRGRFEEAESLLKESAAGMESVLGPDHPVTFSILTNVAHLYSNRGLYGQAVAINRRILEGERKLRGPDHPDTMAAAHNLAVSYQLSGNYAAAAKLHEESLASKRASLGAEHRLTLVAMRSLASSYRETGRLAESARVATEALAISRRVVGALPDTAGIINELARTKKALGNLREAEQLFREALAMRVQSGGARSQTTLVTKNDLAGVLHAQRRYEEAERLFQETLAERKKLFGDQHPSTLNTMSDLGAMYASQRKYAQAEALLSKVVDARRKALGSEHPNTLRAMRELASVLREQGRFADSRTLLDSVLAVVSALSEKGERISGLSEAELRNELVARRQ